MKKYCLSLIAVLLLASVILSGCGDKKAKKELELSSNFNAVDLNNLQGDKSIGDNSQESSKELPPAEVTDLKKEACNLADINGSSLKEISIPKKIGKYDIQQKMYIDKTKVYVVLETKNAESSFTQNELGIYNFETKKYECVFKIKKGTKICILEFNSGYIAYTLEYDNGTMCGDGSNVYNAELWIYNVKAKKSRKLYKYRDTGYFLREAISNKPLIFEGNLYFPDVSADGNSADLWCVGLDSGTPKLLKKNATTPIIYNNQVFVFNALKLPNAYTDILTNLDDSEQVKFEKVLTGFHFTKNAMFISVNDSTVIDLTNNKIIYSSNGASVSTLKGNENYFAMSSFSGYNISPTGDGFYIYSIKSKKFINICHSSEIKLNSPSYKIDFAKDDAIFLATVDELNDEEKTYIVDIKE